MAKPKQTRKFKHTSRAPSDVDRVVGENVRKFRLERGLTLAELGSSLGITHQQLQKYETGANRISAGMLFSLSEVLCVPIESLFQDSPAQKKTGEGSASDDLRRECRFWVEKAQSARTLKDMARILKALSTTP